MRQHHDTNVVAFSKPSIWFNQFPSPLKQNHRYYSIYWKFICIIVVLALIVYIRQADKLKKITLSRNEYQIERRYHVGEDAVKNVQRLVLEYASTQN